MHKSTFTHLLILACLGLLLGLSTACSARQVNPQETIETTQSANKIERYTETETTTQRPSPIPVLQNILLSYIETEHFDEQSQWMKELDDIDSSLSWRWNKIMHYWSRIEHSTINYEHLPEGLSDNNALGLVVLGFELNPDGSIRNELKQRLQLALDCSKQYPNAYIICTGGGTAKNNEDVTEADQMAKWLIEKGVDEKRIIVENQSLTTVENAVYTYRILSNEYPQIKQLAILTSDYHISSGMLFFQAECILEGPDDGDKRVNVVANAACKWPREVFPINFRADGLLNLYTYMK